MNKSHVEGKVDSVKGKVKSAASEFTGSHEHKAEGTVDKVKGAVKEAIGDAKDKLHDISAKVQHKAEQLKK